MDRVYKARFMARVEVRFMVRVEVRFMVRLIEFRLDL